MIGSLLLAFALLAVPDVQADAEGVSGGSEEREALQGHAELCTPELEAALMSVLAVEAELDALTRPIEVDGELVEQPEHYNERLFGEGAPFAKWLAENVARFDLRGKDAPGPSFVVDLVRYDAGFSAAAALVRERDFRVADLLGLFTVEFFAAEPLWGTQEARRYHDSERVVGDLAPLGNGAALAYLTWGLLYQDEYWAEQDRDREGFILELLARGFEGRFVARGVRRALEPPLVPPREATQRTGRGIAGTLDGLRGKVGFGFVHEDQLLADLRTLQAVAEIQSEDPDLDLEHRAVSLGPDGQPEFRLTRRGHLKRWLPMMLQLVRDELYPGGAPEMMRHGGTLEERLVYWRDFFNRYGFVAGRERALEEIEAIVGGLDQHPLTPRIEQLLAQQASSALTAAEQAELERLRKSRDRERNTLISGMVNMLAQVGTMDHYELMLDTLAQDLPGILAGFGPVAQRNLLYNGWMQFVHTPQPLIGRTIQELLDGDMQLPDYARGNLITGYFIMQPEISTAILTEVLERGTIDDKCNAIRNGEWLSAAQLKATVGELLEAYESPEASALLRLDVGAAVLSALEDQPDQGAAKALLVDILEKGLWVKYEYSKGWYDRLDDAALGPDLELWLHTILSSEEIADFKRRGKIPKDIL